MIPKSCRVQLLALVALQWLWFAPLPLWAADTPESEWERTVKAAEQEGQVTVYKIATDLEWEAFQKRYPKIKLNLVQGTAAQHLQRLLAERRAGKFLADVVRLGKENPAAPLPIPDALVTATGGQVVDLRRD
jgi:hypothetical protein